MHNGTTHLHVTDGEAGFQAWNVTANKYNKQRTMGGAVLGFFGANST